MNTVLDEVVDIFIGMGFSIVDGPRSSFPTTTLTV